MNLLSSLLKYTADQIAALRTADSTASGNITALGNRMTTAEGDIDSLEAQFTTVVSAVTTDTEVTNIRVGDDGVTYTSAGEAVRTQFSNVKNNTIEMDLMPKGTSKTENDIIFTVNSDNSVTMSGTASANTSFGYFQSTVSMPAGISAGKSYYIFTDKDATGIKFIINTYNGSWATLIEDYADTSVKKITIPNDAVGLWLRFFIPKNTVVSTTLREFIIKKTPLCDFEAVNGFGSRIDSLEEGEDLLIRVGTNLWNKGGTIEHKYVDSDGTITSNSAWSMQRIDVADYRGKYIKTNATTYGTVIGGFFNSAGTFLGREVGTLLAGSSKLIEATVSYILLAINENCDQSVDSLMVAVSNSATTVSPNYDYYGKKPKLGASKWAGKKIVWFGTSIPAGYGGHIGKNNTYAYPQFVAERLGATVINEAIGSSPAHCKDPSRISDANPYGFDTNFEASSRCLTNTVEEMQWICDHHSDALWTSGVPTWSAWWEAQILSYGYETKLEPYLDEDNFPDLFVFDHGHNDVADTNNYYDTYGTYNLYTFRGAMNFLLKKIFDYNPRAKVVMISEFAKDYRQEMQKTVAEDWNLPYLEQWKRLGWSKSQYVDPYGYWQANAINGYDWVTDSTTHHMTLFNANVPDGIHPHTDTSWKALDKMAVEISNWLENEVSIDL